MPSNQGSKISKIILIIAFFVAIFCFGKITLAADATTTEETIATYSDKIYINEFLPNPSPIDAEDKNDKGEWIELYNADTVDVDLVNWQIGDDTTKIYIIFLKDFPNTVISAGGFFVLEKSITGISLNNSIDEKKGYADKIKLYAPDNMIPLQEIVYSEANKEDVSVARNENGEYKQTTTLTKNGANIITEPIIENSGDGSSGGGGGGGSSSSSGDDSGYVGYLVDKKVSTESSFKDKILITEILPNPIGIDDGEWIEIYNTTTDDFFLDNWKLEDNQNEYIIKNTKLPAKSFLLLPKTETKFVLNNGGDFVELVDLDNKVVARAEYKTAAPENQSYNFCYKKWLWLAPTPNAINFCPLPNKLPVAFFEPTTEEFSIGAEVLLDANESFDEDGQIIKYTWQFEKIVEEIDNWRKEKIFETIIPAFKFKFLSGGKQKITLTITDDLGGEDKFYFEAEVAGAADNKTNESNKTDKTNNKITTKSSGYFAPVDLENVREMEKGSKILVTGVVSVEPGILGADQFYLAGSGLQIYFSKKDFPALAVGDEIQVAGTLATYYNETRLKIANQSDIKILSQNNEAPTPYKIDLDEINEEYEGSLVTVAGDIAEIKGSYLWLDDGLGEIRAYIKKTAPIDLNKLDLKVGDHLTLTGIVSETTAGYRLLPRSESDFMVGKTLGTATKRATKSRWPYYVFPALLAVALVIGGVLWKNKRDKRESEEAVVKF